MPASQNPTKAFKKYCELQFGLKVLKNHKPEENQAEIAQIKAEMDKEEFSFFVGCAKVGP